MIPFKCYLNCDLKDCHSVKRLRVLKNIQEKYETIIFHPIMPVQELLRVYISLEITPDVRMVRRKSRKDDDEEKLIFDMIVSRRSSANGGTGSEHSVFFKDRTRGATSGKDKNIKMKKLPHDSFNISQGMIQIYDTVPLPEDEYYLI